MSVSERLAGGNHRNLRGFKKNRINTREVVTYAYGKVYPDADLLNVN